MAEVIASEALLRAREDEIRAARQHIGELAKAYQGAVARSGRTPIEVVGAPEAAQIPLIARSRLRALDPAVALPTTVDCRAIYQRDRLPDAGQISHQVRVLPALPATLYLIDDRLAVLPRENDALLVHPSVVLDALDSLFEGLWERALPLTRADLDELPVLLLAGLTDQAIARRLGVGHRTVQRRIAALLKELGARTRFQAGVQAALRDRTP